MKLRSKILINAGSDSSGGAGIQADIKTVTSLGGYAMTAVTAITVQNTTGVTSVIPIPAKEIAKQITFTAKDIKPDAIKIGMLHSPDVIHQVLSALNQIKIAKIVLDPVMVAKGGARLINDPAIQVLKNKLMSKAFLVTPNIPEAEILTGKKITNTDGNQSFLQDPRPRWTKNVLLKGGHLKGNYVQDILVTPKKIFMYKNKKLKTKNTHGTGCTLSSAITTFLGCGKPIDKSCELAIRYVNNAIRSNPHYGKGHGPVNHLTSIHLDTKFK